MFYSLALERDFPTPRAWSGKDHLMINYSACTDGELALAWRKGQAEALRVLINRHRAGAFGLALRLCGNRDLAEDLTQEAFLRAVSRLHQYRSEEPFRPWLFRILAHLYIDQLRRRREQPADEEPEPPSVSDMTDSDLFIQGVLSSLNETQRAILVLRELAGLSYEDLARYFSIPIGTVRSRLAHARIAFRTAYLQMSNEGVAR